MATKQTKTRKRPHKRRLPKRTTLADLTITKATLGGRARDCATKAVPLNVPRMMRFTVSTGDADREGDRIPPTGWRLDNFKRNPVVLWAHQHASPPIARATRVWTEASGLKADIEFPPPGLYPFADQIHDLVKAGFLSTTSVGFKAGQKLRNECGGYDWLDPDLLEVSICGVPANPAALIEGRSAHAAMHKWLATTPEREIAIRIVDDPETVRFDPAALVSAFAVTLRSTLDSPAFKAHLRSTVDARVAAKFRQLRGRLD